MSGPKVSEYELQARRQELLRLQMIEEQKRLAREKAERERRARIARDKVIIERCVTDAGKLESNLNAKWRALLSRVRAMNLTMDDDSFAAFLEAIKQFKTQYAGGAALAEDEQNAVRCQAALASMQMDVKQLESKIASVEAVLHAKNLAMAAEEYRKHEAERAAEKQKRNQKKGEDARNEFEAVMRLLAKYHSESPVYLRDEFKRLIQRMKLIGEKFSDPSVQLQLLHEFRLIELAVFEKKHAQWKKCAPLREEFVSLSAMLAREVPADIDTMTEEALSKGVLCLSEALMEKRSQAYITNAVRECMAEMGYKFVGETSGDYSQDMLYQVHGKTVMHVSCTSEGQIAMEIGVASARNRALETHEMGALIDDMTSFCKKYPAFQSKLAGKGVRLKKDVCLLPPTREYAKVIETEAFGISSAAFESGARSEAGEAKKYLRVEGN